MAANNLLSLDVGEKRIGVARAGAVARLAQPYGTILNDANVYQNISKLIADLEVNRVIVGLPRNTNNEDTAQTEFVRRFTDGLTSTNQTINIEFQDEANTSQKAEAELTARNKTYEKGDIDALAATYILQDYLDQHLGSAL